MKVNIMPKIEATSAEVLFSLPSSSPFDGFDIEIDFAVLDDLFQVVDVVRSEFLVFQVFGQCFVDGVFQSHRNLFLRIECCCGWVL